MEATTSPPAGLRQRLGRLLRAREAVLVWALLGTALLFYFAQPDRTNRFLTASNLQALLLSVSLDGLMAIGQTLVIISGGFDLSVGSAFAFGGLLAGLAASGGAGAPAAVVAGLLGGAFIGVLNGLLITRLRVNPLVTTLGTMSFFRSVVLVVTQGNPVTGFPASFRALGEGSIAGIFYPILALLVAMALADLLLRNLALLRELYYAGGNEDAARLSGIRVERVRTLAYVVTGILSALAGVFAAAKTGSASPVAGMGAELRVIAAVVIGGASLAGGQGSILGTFLGLLLTGVIANGLGFVRVSYYAEGMVSGTILVAAVMLDQLRGERWQRLVRWLTVTENKAMERKLNVVMGLVIIALAVALVWPRAGRSAAGPAAASGVREEYIFIGVSVSNPYWYDARLGLEAKARQLSVSTDFRGPAGNDPNQQVIEMERAIARRPAGILIAPASEALNPVINRAVDSGIPVICVDTDAKDSKRSAYVGTSNYAAGFQAGTLLGAVLGGHGKVALLSIPGQSNLEARVRGYRDALQKHPDIQIVKIGNDLGLPTEAEKVSRSILQAFPDLAAFGACDAAGGEGAAVAVKEAGLTGKVRIVAMDRNDATLNLIEEGIIQASLAQRTYTMTYLGLELLYDLVHNRMQMTNDWRKTGVLPFPPEIDTGVVAVDPSNVAAFKRK